MPRDPGLCRKKPDGDSVYARAGGVYPIAQFVDALVDLCVAPEAAALGYELWEALCWRRGALRYYRAAADLRGGGRGVGAAD